METVKCLCGGNPLVCFEGMDIMVVCDECGVSVSTSPEKGETERQQMKRVVMLWNNKQNQLANVEKMDNDCKYCKKDGCELCVNRGDYIDCELREIHDECKMYERARFCRRCGRNLVDMKNYIKYIERCKEILAELNQMPLDVYVSFICGALIHFRKYHPLDWKSLNRFMDGEISFPFPLSEEIIG